ncbi:hypothetical protein [Paracoccus sp. PAR01]|uniref:hypothetical protein n=1 Tax=Paracoccus sp. PAR01 TaxID=2769282 RepID=UPI00177F8428|nr:hypothetical protein [Paracoccus sp. PAR01]MBD9527839.1 hypothetical protein [Paracoccus sp. PAR01]
MPDRPCAHCGKPILTKNTRAEYCSPSCRVMAHRKRKDEIPSNMIAAVKEYVDQMIAAQDEARKWELRAGQYLLELEQLRHSTTTSKITESDRKAIVKALHPNSNPSKDTLAKAYAAWQNIAG